MAVLIEYLDTIGLAIRYQQPPASIAVRQIEPSWRHGGDFWMSSSALHGTASRFTVPVKVEMEIAA